MVSFFGIKLGGDKKKSQKTQDKQPQKWNRIDQNTLGEGQYFGRNHDLARPKFPNASDRPGTSHSTTPTPSNWRAVFNNPGMTSSMTDLTPPTMGALRHNASESNLRTNFAGGSTTSLALPAPLGGTGVRPGTPNRPTTSKAEWVNPLDVHFCKSTSTSRPGTPVGSNAKGVPKSPLSQFEFDIKPGPVVTAAPPESKQDDPPPLVGQHGYPSPPESDRNSDRAFSPSYTIVTGKKQ
ncbi:ahpC/TSA antioxidant enzyme domain-containing protein [Purpureocillium lavendulum]|uniref:AhpC/TSA antioxidant enzyme domain-containing protein n=1 Tax=Purpureocillium lavendulum TaxID=1247861 RepID=A0AB34G7V4_9HYPO|nr:ahpC/TSA antioxidant enzyme domain-containing protein [Purpureocillium lavendulum]